MNILTVTFRNSYDQERVIGTVSGPDKEETLAAAHRIITKFCEERNFKVYYLREHQMTMNGIDNVTWVDAGSHSEFFYIYPTDRMTVGEAIENAKIESAF